jgi:hypothetical protein
MKVLFSAYRLNQYADPEGFKLNIGLVLEQYPIETIRFVCDPRTGVQRTSEWPPSVANMVTACEAHIASVAKLARFENWGKRAAEEFMLEGPQEPKPTLEELHAKYGKDWGLGRDEARVKAMEPAPSWDTIVKQYQNDPSAIARLTGALMTRNAK